MFEAVPSCSGGKVFENCQHHIYNAVVVYVQNISMAFSKRNDTIQVIFGSKFILKKGVYVILWIYCCPLNTT